MRDKCAIMSRQGCFLECREPFVIYRISFIVNNLSGVVHHFPSDLAQGMLNKQMNVRLIHN